MATSMFSPSDKMRQGIKREYPNKNRTIIKTSIGANRILFFNGIIMCFRLYFFFIEIWLSRRKIFPYKMVGIGIKVHEVLAHTLVSLIVTITMPTMFIFEFVHIK